MDISQFISTDLSEQFLQIKILFFQQFHTWLNSQFTNNQFLVAGVFTVLLSSLLYVLRNIPSMIWKFLAYRFSVSVTIYNNNANFYDIAKELNKNTIQLFSRHKVLDANHLTIGIGQSVSWFRGRLVKVVRQNEKTDARQFKQVLQLTFPFLSYKKLNKLFQDFLEEKKKENQSKVSVYTTRDSYMEHMKDTEKRKRDSVFLPEGVLNYVESRIDYFLTNKDWYRDRGIPYKYAILLHGVPGTGKTTLAKYIASYTDRSLVLVTPSKLAKIASAISSREGDEYFDSHELAMSEKAQPQKYVGLMEDIDCDVVTAKRKKKTPTKSNINTDDDDDSSSKKNVFVNLSDLLNSIDGLNAPEDFILVATTNHLEDLDPALLRKGRFDDIIEIKPLETPEIIKMIAVFRGIPEDELKGKSFAPIAGSVLQDLILQYTDKSLEELLTAINNRKV